MTDINPLTFAKNVRVLLDENPLRYRAFGPFWFFVKALLKRVYDKNQMPMLGDYEDKSVSDRLPTGLSALEMIARAAQEYEQNASFALGSGWVTDDDGERFMLLDTDIEG